MDQARTGKFIAELRRREGLTQQQLGERIGVTNKTVSRWENGNYMPDIDMLQLLGDVFKISVNEMIAGKERSDEAFRKQADKNLVAVSRSSIFTFSERKNFWKKKWRNEHISLFAVFIIIDMALVIGAIMFHKPWIIGLMGPLILFEYAWQNNQMMMYVENNLYRKNDAQHCDTANHG